MSEVSRDFYQQRFPLPALPGGIQQADYMAKTQDKSPQFAVVIPSYHEDGNIRLLDSLASCYPPLRPAWVTIVLNFPEGSSEEIQSHAHSQQRVIEEWQKANLPDWMVLCVISAFQIPQKKAGVGLSRKIGLDNVILNPLFPLDSGVLVCLDADCVVSKDYFRELEKHFESHPEISGCSIGYKHRLDAPGKNQLEAIKQYELHLKLYTRFVQSTGCPFGYHTVGSSMCVKGSEYIKQGGMNVRKAGEDFYFLQKFMKNGIFSRLNKALVFPSSRVSHRVPFGTGRAMSEMAKENGYSYFTYPYEIFKILGDLIKNLPEYYISGDFSSLKLHPCLLDYCTSITDLDQQMHRARIQSDTYDKFLKQFFASMDAFWIMKWANHSVNQWTCKTPVIKVDQSYLQHYQTSEANEGASNDVTELLAHIDQLDSYLPVTDPLCRSKD